MLTRKIVLYYPKNSFRKTILQYKYNNAYQKNGFVLPKNGFRKTILQYV